MGKAKIQNKKIPKKSKKIVPKKKEVEEIPLPSVRKSDAPIPAKVCSFIVTWYGLLDPTILVTCFSFVSSFDYFCQIFFLERLD